MRVNFTHILPFPPLSLFWLQERGKNTDFNRLQPYMSFTVKIPKYLSICSFLLHKNRLCTFFKQNKPAPHPPSTA